MKKTKYNPLHPQGYSLLELVLALAIVSVLVGLLLPKGLDALRNTRVQPVAKTVDTLKAALADYLAMPSGSGSLPRTEGTGVPCSGAALSGAPTSPRATAPGLTPSCWRSASWNGPSACGWAASSTPPAAPAMK